MEFFITKQLFEWPWEPNHKPSTPTDDASNNLVNIQSPVAVFETASLNSLINIASKYGTRRVKLSLSKFLTPLPWWQVLVRLRRDSTCLLCSFAHSWVHQNASQMISTQVLGASLCEATVDSVSIGCSVYHRDICSTTFGCWFCECKEEWCPHQ